MNIKNVTKFIVRTDTVDAFLEDIKGIKPMSAKEEKEAFERYKEAKTEKERIEIRNEIIIRNIWFIYAVAKRYDANEREDSKVLEYVNIGFIGMTEAFDKYDIESGNRFCTFAVWYIRRAINGFINNEDMLVVPTNHQRISPKIKKIEEEFVRKYNIKPTVEEIRDILFSDYGVEIVDKNDLYGLTVDYIEDAVKEDSDSCTKEDYSDFAEHTAIDNEYEDTIESDDMSYEMSVAMGTLDKRAQKVIKMAFGIGYLKEYNNKEIAEEIGITAERVRQIKNESLEKLEKVYSSLSV